MTEENNELTPKFDPKTGKKLVEETENMPLRFNPKTGEPITGNAPSVERKGMDVNKWLDTIKKHKIITAAVVILGIGAISVSAVLNMPKVKVTRACIKTFKSMSRYETALDSKLGKKKIVDALLTGKSQQELSLSINKINTDEYIEPFIKNLGLNIRFANDVKGNKLMAQIEALYKDDMLVSTSIYNDKEQVMLYIPELYDEYFYINKEHLSSQFKDSEFNQYLLRYMGYDSEINLEDLNSNAVGDFWATYTADNQSLLKDIYSQMTVEKNKERNFRINGKSRSYKGYTITISDKNIKQLLSSLNKAIQRDKELENIFLCLGMTKSQYEYTLQDIEASIEVIKDSIQDDLVYDLYINNKGEIIYFESENELDIDNNILTASVEADFSGGKNIYDNMMLECTLEQNRERIGFSLERESKVKGNEYESSTEITVMDQYDEMTLNAETSFNQKTGVFEASWKAQDGYNDMTSLQIEGKLENIKKSKGFDVTFDTIKLADRWNEEIVLEGSYSVGELKESITKPSNKGEDLLDNSYEDIAKIAQKMGNKLERIGEEIYSS